MANLASPDIISLEEVQDNDGATNDGVVAADQTITKLEAAIKAAGGPAYDSRSVDPVNDQDGGQPGGNIRNVFLFNPAVVSFVDAGATTVDRSTRQATTTRRWWTLRRSRNRGAFRATPHHIDDLALASSSEAGRQRWTGTTPGSMSSRPPKNLVTSS